MIMFKGKNQKAIIGIVLAVALFIGTVIAPLQSALADSAQTVTGGAYFDLPQTVDNYASSGKTLEFDLNILIESTDVCKLRLYNGASPVSLTFILRDGEEGLKMMIEPIEGGWYHYIISLNSVPHNGAQGTGSVTRIRAQSSFPTGTQIKNISIGEDVQSLPETFTKDYDTVTFADLGVAGIDYETSVSKGSYSYNGKSATNSVIFKFGWEANISNDIDLKIAFDTYWNTNCTVWFRPDATYFCSGQGSFKELSVNAAPVTSGRHDVEFGRLRVTAGPNHGMDYVFLKIDGNVKAEKYTKHYQTAGGYFAYKDGNNDVKTVPSYTIHFTNEGTSEQGFSGFGKSNTITVDVLGKKYTYYSPQGLYYMPEAPKIAGKVFVGFYNGNTKYNGYTNGDINLTAKYEDIQYEKYDTISLKDLGVKENKILNQTNTVYTYEKTAKSGGRLLQFVLEPIGNMENGEGPHIALTNDWAKNGYARVWFKNNTDSYVYYNGGNKYDIAKKLSLEDGKQYNIEFAVRVMKNKGYEGKKVFEITVNGELLVQHIGCEADLSGNMIFFHGNTGAVYLINKPVYKTVKFYNGDTLIGSYEVERFDLLPKVKEPAAKNGLPFAGWYTEKSGGTLWDENADRVLDDMSLYAHFANVKVITANVEGKTLTYRVKVGNTLDELPKPQKAGHVFTGWTVNGKLFTGKVTSKMDITASFEEYSFDEWDEISLRDLGINNDLEFASLGEKHHAGFTYHKAAKTGGRVFKAIYIPTEKMSNGPQVSFSTRWDENYFAKLYFTKADMLYVYSSGIDGGLPTLKLDYDLVGGKEYFFEIGVRVLNNKGYKGIKVLTVYMNGELIFEEFDNRANIEGSVVFFQGLPNTGIFRNVDIYKTVSFYDGDKLLSSVKVLRGNTVKSYGKLADKGDRLFINWFTEFGEEWKFDTDGVYLDTVLKAKFQKRTYPVLLMVDGVLYKRLNIVAGESADIFDIPTKKGFEFDKWLCVDGTEYDMKTPINAPITLVANFKAATAADSVPQSENVKPIQNPDKQSSNLKYILFSIIGLAVIAAETGVIIYKKRSKR